MSDQGGVVRSTSKDREVETVRPVETEKFRTGRRY